MNTYASATDAAVAVCKASDQDISAILDLINGYASAGVMLPRTEAELRAGLGNFWVARENGRIAGCVALCSYGARLAEVRSLAVHPDYEGRGIGRQLVEAAVESASDAGVGAVFAFTLVPGFFRKAGFEEADRGLLPVKVWKDCIRCPKISCCDEIAMIRTLRPGYAPDPCEQTDAGSVVFPILRS